MGEKRYRNTKTTALFGVFQLPEIDRQMMGREYNIPARASPTRILSPRQQHELHPPKRAPSQHRMSCLLGGTPAVCHWRKLHPGPWLGSSTALPPTPPGEKKKSDNFLTINNVFLYVKLRSLWSLLNHRILGPGPGESEELGKPAPWNASPSVSWDYCGTATSRSSARSDRASFHCLYLGALLSLLLRSLPSRTRVCTDEPEGAPWFWPAEPTLEHPSNSANPPSIF